MLDQRILRKVCLSHIIGNDNESLQEESVWALQQHAVVVLLACYQGGNRKEYLVTSNMDFSRFSDENFDEKEWVNSALKAHKDAGLTLENHASNIVMKLQLFIQEVNKSIEESSQIALNNIPRVMREIDCIRNEGQMLEEQMQTVKDDIKKVEKSTAQSMKTLVEIDTVKGRVQAASLGLREADNWTKLSCDVEDIFRSGDTDEIGAKLIGMQRSLIALQDVPDYAERMRFLEGLKNRFEALLSTKVVAAFNNHDAKNAKEFVRIFTEIQRFSHLQTYYNNCHKSHFLTVWSEVREDPSQSIATWLPTFYDGLFSLLQTESSWCRNVFPQPFLVLSSLAVQTLTSLDPSIEDCIATAVSKDDRPLECLIHLRQITNRLTTDLNSTALPYQDDQSMAALVELTDTLQAPYMPYLLQYGELQKSQLIQGLEELDFDAQDVSDVVNNMSNSVSQALHAAFQSLESCWQFTDSFGAVGLLDALEHYFAVYLGKLDCQIQELRKTCIVKTGGLSSLDNEDQWTNFQSAFKLLEMCGDLIIKVSEFREKLTKTLTKRLQDLMSKINSDRTTQLYNYLRLKKPNDFEYLIEFYERVSEYGVNVILPSTPESVKNLNDKTHEFAFDVVFTQLQRYLMDLPKLEIWSTETPSTGALMDTLPVFSLSPQGYITKVGDYLLTIPQQIEPFFAQENPALTVALENGKIPYAEKQDSSCEHFDHYWVGGFALGVMQTFTVSVLRIPELTEYSCRQLLADTDYFCNVLEALEVNSSKELKDIKQLLEIKPEGYHNDAVKLGVDSKIESAIARIRKISM